MEFSEVIQNVFYAMATLIGTLGVSTLRKMNESIAELNLKVAVVVNKVENHDKRISNLEEEN